MAALPKVRSALEEMDDKGNFARTASTFRNWIKDEPGAEFPAAKDRYHLYVSYACPWAHRTLIVRALKGLQDVISISVVHPTWLKTNPSDPTDPHEGWIFRDPKDPPVSNVNGFGAIVCDDCIPDYLNNCKTVRDVYALSGGSHKASVPVLWDKQKKCIVNNESSEIIEMLNNQFNKFSSNPEMDLNSADTLEAQKEANAWIYDNINNGVYKCGFAKSQEAYEKAFVALFDNLDRLETLLSKQRYVTGDKFTLADIRTFVTLIRFDEVYVVYFKCNKKRIADYPNILEYVREIYQMEGVKDTVNMNHIKRHYFTAHVSLGPYAVVPMGPNFLGLLAQAHSRAETSNKRQRL